MADMIFLFVCGMMMGAGVTHIVMSRRLQQANQLLKRAMTGVEAARQQLKVDEDLLRQQMDVIRQLRASR